MIFTNKQLSVLYFQGEYYRISELCESNSVAAIHVSLFGKYKDWILISYDKDGGERWHQCIFSRKTRTPLVDVPSGAVGHAFSPEGEPIIGIRDNRILKTLKVIENKEIISLEEHRQYEYRTPEDRLIDYLDPNSDKCYKSSFAPVVSDKLFNSVKVNDDIALTVSLGSPRSPSRVAATLSSDQILKVIEKCKSANALKTQKGKKPRFIPFYFNDHWVKSNYPPDNAVKDFPHADVDFSLFLTDRPEVATNWHSLLNSAKKIMRNGDNLHTASASMVQAIHISQHLEVDHNVFIHKGHYQRTRIVSNSSLSNHPNPTPGTITVFSASEDARVTNITDPELAYLSESMNMNWISIRYTPGGHISCPPLISEVIQNLQTYIANGHSIERFLKNEQFFTIDNCCSRRNGIYL